MTCEIHNASPNGSPTSPSTSGWSRVISSSTVRCNAEATVFARNAVVGWGSTKLALPHTVRLSSTTFDTEEDHAASITVTLHWSDESGKAWMRIGPGRAQRCKPKISPIERLGERREVARGAAPSAVTTQSSSQDVERGARRAPTNIAVVSEPETEQSAVVDSVSQADIHDVLVQEEAIRDRGWQVVRVHGDDVLETMQRRDLIRKCEPASYLPLVDSIEEMAVMDQKARPNPPFDTDLRNEDVKAEHLHVVDALALPASIEIEKVGPFSDDPISRLPTRSS